MRARLQPPNKATGSAASPSGLDKADDSPPPCHVRWRTVPEENFGSDWMITAGGVFNLLSALFGLGQPPLGQLWMVQNQIGTTWSLSLWSALTSDWNLVDNDSMTAGGIEGPDGL